MNASTIYSAVTEYHCIPGYKHPPNSPTILTCTEFGTWSPPTPPVCLSPDDDPEIFKKLESPQESSTSIVGIVIGIIIALFAIFTLVVLLLWILKRNKENDKGGGGSSVSSNRAASSMSRTENLKAEPMVVFPNHTTTINGNPIGIPPDQNYYDNPTVDPIYENLDDYGTTTPGYGVAGSSSAASVVTINGVAVS